MKKNDLFLRRLEKWDKQCIIKYNGYGGKALIALLKPLSFLGRETLWLSLSVYFLFIWYDRLLFSSIASTFFLGVIIIAPMKRILERDRPFEELSEITILDRKPSSRSFPSWHAYNVISQGLIFIFLFQSVWVTIMIGIIAYLVCFSRIQLGVHYPSDVIMGAIIGIIGFLVAYFFFIPFIINFLAFLEQFIPGQIQYHRFNSLITQNFLYLLLIIGLYTVIILIALIDKLKLVFKKK